MWTPEEKFETFVIRYMELVQVADDITETEEDTQVVVSGYYVAVTVVHEVGVDKTEYIYFKSDGIEITLYNYLGGKYHVRDNDEFRF